MAYCPPPSPPHAAPSPQIDASTAPSRPRAADSAQGVPARAQAPGPLAEGEGALALHMWGGLLHGDVGDRRDRCRLPPSLSSINGVQGPARGADALLLMPRAASGARSRGMPSHTQCTAASMSLCRGAGGMRVGTETVNGPRTPNASP